MNQRRDTAVRLFNDFRKRARRAVNNLRNAAAQLAVKTVETAKTPVDRGSIARELYEKQSYAEAATTLRAVLKTSPEGPLTTYLLGLCQLQQGSLDEGRQLIERAYELRHWLDDHMSSPNAVDLLRTVRTRFPDWAWPQYQLERKRWNTGRLSLGSAVAFLSTKSRQPPFFVQIGANDGKRGDPLYSLIRTHEMSGLYVEPQPEPFAELQALNKDMSQVSFANVAITEVEGPITMFTTPSRTTIGTILPDRNIMRNRTDTHEIIVPGIRFESLIKEYDIEKCDVLQIDTEGFDLRILKQVPLEQLDVKIVNMELYCLPIEERLATFKLLHNAGFATLPSEMDLLAVRTNNFADDFQLTRNYTD